MLSVTLAITVVVLAVIFDFINGFHDTANCIATSVSTRVLSPRTAIIIASICNFVGAISSQKVAGTIAKDLVDNRMIGLYVIIAALVSSIIWNLVTWYFAIPSSSSHALFGSIIGASIAHTSGFQVIKWTGVFNKIIIPLFTSPIIGFLLGFILMKLLARLLAPFTHQFVNRWFSKLQIVSAILMSYSHGNNDAQKSMGIITLALVAANLNGGSDSTQTWVIIVCALAMALGTSIGGWKIIKTVGVNMMKMEPINGFAAQTGAAAVIETMTHFGAPVSTTHIITTAVMGVGASKRLSAVRWVLAKNIVWAWILTIPITGIIGAMIALIFKLIGM